MIAQEEHSFLIDENDIKAWLKKQDILTYQIKKIPNGLVVDVKEKVEIKEKNLTHFPIQFGVVEHDFICQHTQLTSLKGSPQKVLGSFVVSHNKLKNLNYSPEFVNGTYDCQHNSLRTIQGISQKVGALICANNEIDSLFDLPKEIKLALDCQNNKITQLMNIPNGLIRLDLSGNQLTSLKGLPKKCENLLLQKMSATLKDISSLEKTFFDFTIIDIKNVKAINLLFLLNTSYNQLILNTNIPISELDCSKPIFNRDGMDVPYHYSLSASKINEILEKIKLERNLKIPLINKNKIKL